MQISTGISSASPSRLRAEKKTLEGIQTVGHSKDFTSMKLFDISTERACAYRVHATRCGGARLWNA